MERKQSKRYYWIKVCEGFLHSDAVSYVMNMKHGHDYVLLYMYILDAYKNSGDGILVKHIENKIIACTANDIQQKCKFFPLGIVKAAIEVYKDVGLFYETDEKHYLAITDFDNWVGSKDVDSDRRNVSRHKKTVKQADKVQTMSGQCHSKIQEIRYKIQEIQILQALVVIIKNHHQVPLTINISNPLIS